VQVFQRSLEGVLAAVSDAGIAMATLMTAARAFGLGVVPIGGIRRDPQAMIDLLRLPPNTFPVDGVVLGYVEEESPQKPRMAIESFCHEETYHPELLKPAIDAYDLTLLEYWLKIGRADGLSWSANIAQHYGTLSRRIKTVAQKQGFTIEV
jgi:FMN reductase [NAD(P)H]